MIAFLVDLVSLGLVSALSLLVTGSLTQVTSDNLQQFDPTDRTLELGDSIYVIQPSLLTWLIPVLFFVGMMVALQGLTGLTLGKAATGVRSVGSDGGVPGIGRALVRSLFAAVGILAAVATWMQLPTEWTDFPRFVAMIGVFSLVGAITAIMASTSAGHRRLGDRLSGTFVVDRSFAGRPLRISGSGVETMQSEDRIIEDQPVTATKAEVKVPAVAQAETAADDLWTPKPLDTPNVDLPQTEATPITVEATPLVGATDTSTDLLDRGRSALGANDAIGDITSGVDNQAPAVVGNLGNVGSEISSQATAAPANVRETVSSFTPRVDSTSPTPGIAAAASNTGDLGQPGRDVEDVIDISTPAAEGTAAVEDPMTPRWDPDRQAYIVWDQSRAEWLEYDDSRQAWKQISRA